MALRDTEYMYISAAISAKEGQISGKVRVRSYLECDTLSELCALVGVEVDAEGEREALEAHFDKAVRDAFEFVKRNAPTPEYFDFLLYEYDACNLKTLLKGMIREMNVDSMLYEIGSASVDDLKNALITRKFDEVLPKNMAEAATEAYEAYSRTRDARVIDLIIDKACFADMLENAGLCGCKLAIDLVRVRIDSINIMTLQRILKSDIPDKVSTLDMAFILGAEISLDRLIRVIEDSEYSLLDALDGTKYKDIVRSLGSDFGFLALERALDMEYLSLIEDVKYIPFGAEVVCSYLVNTLNEAKNARIIIAGISAALTKEKLRERLRI